MDKGTAVTEDVVETEVVDIDEELPQLYPPALKSTERGVYTRLQSSHAIHDIMALCIAKLERKIVRQLVGVPKWSGPGQRAIRYNMREWSEARTYCLSSSAPSGAIWIEG